MTTRAEWHVRGPRGGDVGLEVAGRILVNDAASLLEATLAGAGVAKLPSFLAEGPLARGALVAVLEDFRESDLGIWALHPAGRAPQPKVRAVVDFLAETLPSRVSSLASAVALRNGSGALSVPGLGGPRARRRAGS